MKKLICHIIFISLVLGNIHLSQAQDTIKLKNGNEIKAKVLEVTSASIKYKEYAHIEGTTRILKTSDASMIAYENGEKVDLTLASKDQNKAFHNAAKKGDKAKVEELIKIGVDLNSKGFYETTPLMSASHKGQTEIVKILLDAGADVNAQDKDGRTAMHFAKARNHTDIIELLKNAAKPKPDLSFFSTEELKEMYKQAIKNNDDENISLIQKELTDRAEVSAKTSVTTAQLRGSGDPLKGLNVAAAKQKMEIGNYYALIIGINNYKGAWLPLKNAVGDAKAVENLLRTKYKIDHFRTLTNELATRKNIMKELSWLVDNVTENDNVFIYFSGHGEYKEKLNKGYWVPVEAQTTETYEFISNSAIQTYLNGIKSKHTLLVSDACFSGDIFRGKTISVQFEQTSIYYTKVHNLRSRQAFTSGGVEPVMDGGREGHSVFTYYLLEMLKRNESKYYDAGQLYNDMKIPVTNNSDQTPILQPVKNTGDEGGQFIFIKK